MKSYDSQLACPQARRRVRPPLLRSFNDTRGKGDPGGLRAGKAHLASDDARIAGSQDDPTCTSWLQRLSLLTSPPDASIPAGGRSKTHWPPSNSAICNPSLSPCCGRWSRLGQNAGAQVLLGLMLLLGVSRRDPGANQHYDYVDKDLWTGEPQFTTSKCEPFNF